MKLLTLNSGGMDSPVATHRMLASGHDTAAIVFDNRPFTSEEDVETAVDTVERLAEMYGTTIRTYIVPHGFVQERFLEKADRDEVKFSCLFSRRMMLRVCSRLAEQENFDGLVTGENLAQVASQTLDNLVVIDDASTTPVFRPLLGEEKNDVVGEAREIGTFEISSRGGIVCAATPDYPETHAVLEEVKQVEERFDLDGLVEESLEEMEEYGVGISSE